MRRVFFLTFVLPVFHLSVSAEQVSLHKVEICDYRPAWSDKGSGGDNDVAIYTPRVPAGAYMTGSYVQGDYSTPSQCIVGVKPANEQSQALLTVPDSWQLIWQDKGSGADLDGSVWSAVTKNSDYICTGHVGQRGYTAPVLPEYRCLHRCLVSETGIGKYIWSDRGTGARKPVSLYRLPRSKGFIAVPSRQAPRAGMDITEPLVCDVSEIQTSQKEMNRNVPATPGPGQQEAKPQPKKQWKDPDSQPPTNRPRSNSEWINPDT